MKLIINKTILLENLDYVSKALSTRNIIPVLNGIKFELTKFLLKSDLTKVLTAKAHTTMKSTK